MKENMLITKSAIEFYAQLTDEEIAIYEATHQPDWLLD